MKRFFLVFISTCCVSFQNCSSERNGFNSLSDTNRTVSSITSSKNIGLSKILSGTAYFIKVNTSFGSLKSGMYLFYHNPTNRKDTLSLLSEYNNIFEYDSLKAEEGIYSFWGTPGKLIQIGNDTCFTFSFDKNICDVKIISEFTDTDIPNIHDFIEQYRKGTDSNAGLTKYLSMWRRVIANQDPNLGRCPTNSSIVMTNDAYRELGRRIKESARLLPFIYSKNEYEELRSELNDSVNFLMTSFNANVDPTWTSYSQCYNAHEIETVRYVAQGVAEFYKLTKQEPAATYVRQIWNSSLPLIKTYSDSWQSGTLPSKNAFAQYLQFAIAAKEAGADAIQASFTADTMKMQLFSQYTSNNQPQCSESFPNGVKYDFPYYYGGWDHDASDCLEKIWYHQIIMDALLKIHQYAGCKPNSVVHPYWQWTCDNIPGNIFAALAWVNNLFQGDGTSIDIAFGGKQWNGVNVVDVNPTYEGTHYATWIYYSTFNVMTPLYGIDTPIVRDFVGTRKTLAEIQKDALASVKKNLISYPAGTHYFIPEYLRFKFPGVVPN